MQKICSLFHEEMIRMIQYSKPLIGVVPLIDVQRDSLWMLPGYLNRIVRAGGVPMILPLTSEQDVLYRAMDVCGGFLLTGGQDVSPQRYGETPLPQCGEVSPERDAMETMLLDRALESDKAVLGICRGIQFLNVYCGGTLWQDIPTQCPSDTEHHMSPPYDRTVHHVSIIPGTKLHQILGCTELAVNSYHHQAIRKQGSGLQASAVSGDGLIEAVEMPAHRFVCAVQWHPEFAPVQDAAAQQLFGALIAAAR